MLGTSSTVEKDSAKEKDENGEEEKMIKNGLLQVNDIDDDDDEELTLEDLAPDGGWGWMVALAMIIVFVTTFSASPSFAIIFGEFFESTGQSGSAMTLLNSVFMVSFSVSGFMTNMLLKRYSMRAVGVTGAVLYCVPNVLAALVTHVYEMAVIFFIQGIGGGLVNTICNANFNAFFVKKRAMVMSGAQVIVGVGSIIYPIFIGEMMPLYGFRGTAALVGALSLNSIFGMMLMHPVEWHLRDPREVREERRKLIQEKLSNEKAYIGMFTHAEGMGRRSTVAEIKLTLQLNRWSSLGDLNESPGHHAPLLIDALKERVASISDVENGNERPRSNSFKIKRPLQQRLSTLSGSSIGNIAGALAEVQHRIDHQPKHVNEAPGARSEKILQETKDLIVKKNSRSSQIETKEEYSLLAMLSDIFELSILKDRTFMIMSLGISFVFVSDFTFSSLLPLAMLEAGYNTGDTSMTITVGAAAELVSRIFLTAFTFFVDARAKTLFFFATIAMALAKLGYLYLEHSLTGIMISVVLIGIVRSWLYVPQPLVVVEHYPVEKYAACYGIFSLVSGLIMIVAGPLLGIIKDLTNSFSVCQFLLIATNCFLVVPWGWELLMNCRGEKKQSKRRQSLKNSKSVTLS